MEECPRLILYEHSGTLIGMDRQRTTCPGAIADGQSGDLGIGPAIADTATVKALLDLADQTGEDELGGVIGSLREQGEHCVAVVRSALTGGDSSAVTAVTHGLTGSAGAMGASMLEAVSRRICESARYGGLEEASALVEQLQGALERALHELDEHHRQWRQPGGAGSKQEPAR